MSAASAAKHLTAKPASFLQLTPTPACSTSLQNTNKYCTDDDDDDDEDDDTPGHTARLSPKKRTVSMHSGSSNATSVESDVHRAVYEKPVYEKPLEITFTDFTTPTLVSDGSNDGRSSDYSDKTPTDSRDQSETLNKSSFSSKDSQESLKQVAQKLNKNLLGFTDVRNPASINSDTPSSSRDSLKKPHELASPRITINTDPSVSKEISDTSTSSREASAEPSTPKEPAQSSASGPNPEATIKELARTATDPVVLRTASPANLRHSNTDPTGINSNLSSSRHDLIEPVTEPRRRHKDHHEDDSVLVGNKVAEGHKYFEIMYNMLTGIRVSVSRCNAKVDRFLTDEDFVLKQKLAFDVAGNETTPSAKYDFKFKDYSPWVFRHLRQLFKIEPAEYLMSVAGKYLLSEMNSPGKSGSKFFFTRDYRFIIKTLHHSEHKMLRRILKDYYKHVEQNPNTLLSQFYGLHRVKMPFGRKIHFVVMNNLFPAHRDTHRVYDLKGSTLGREYVERTIGPQSIPSESPHKLVVLKDTNWVRSNDRLYLSPQKSLLFIGQIERDVELLRRLNIMDYSMLIGIHDLNRGNTENIRRSILSVFDPDRTTETSCKSVGYLRRALTQTSLTSISPQDLDSPKFNDHHAFYKDDGGLQATGGRNEALPEIYYFGIIDCLTRYTFLKRTETFFKSLNHPKTEISAIPAADYGDRFVRFMREIVDTQGAVKESTDAKEPSPVSIEPHLPALTEAREGETKTIKDQL